MIRWLAASCFLAMAVPGRADEPHDAWTVGTRAFRTGRERLQSGQSSRAEFRRAALAFAEAVDPRHAESHLNLGNAHFLAGDLPEAIAAFNAGLAIDPSDGRLHENLALARREVSSPAGSKLVMPGPAWQRFLFQTWLGDFAALALMGSSLLVPAGLRLGRRRSVAVGLGFGMIAAVAVCALMLRACYVDDLDHYPICVIRADTPLRIGNAESYATHPDVPNLPRGYEVRRLGQRGGWIHVECPGGSIGWVPEGKVVPFATSRRNGRVEAS